ncbi:ROK family protein [Nocardia sp. alder85J]|uniref:ROK family protein n=1 Tax=Nocardia sp. alder85J TaxID=2862949 RepID=UPI001CD3A9B4|nr:ROK family protein [Nocardia sp. alder85J]MCX4097927.1 ROK family protein [Nocardia sp. alder85J]
MTVETAPVIVFDIGGTSWRTARSAGTGILTGLAVQSAVTRSRTGAHAASLHEVMVAFLLRRVREIRESDPDISTVGISLGAATNGHTGHVLASAPLWGDYTQPFDLRAVLTAAEPGLDWCVVNDVTALALAITDTDTIRDSGLQVVTAVTVGSGIAARTIDVASGEPCLDRVYGMQGEIGHLPAVLVGGPGHDAPVCECGVAGHVSAFSSGKAIEAQLRQLAGVLGLGDTDGEDPASLTGQLAAALAARHPAALEFLDHVTAPLARALLYTLAIDARVDRVMLSGGVVDALGEDYLASVYRHLEADGLYLYPPGVFRDKVVWWRSDGLDPLRGAAVYARRQRAQAAGPVSGNRC